MALLDAAHRAGIADRFELGSIDVVDEAARTHRVRPGRGQTGM